MARPAVTTRKPMSLPPGLLFARPEKMRTSFGSQMCKKLRTNAMAPKTSANTPPATMGTMRSSMGISQLSGTRGPKAH